MLSIDGGNLARNTDRCVCGSGTLVSDDTAVWYIEKSFPKGEPAVVTEKALEVSGSPIPLLLEVPEEPSSEVRQVPKLLLPGALRFHG